MSALTEDRNTPTQLGEQFSHPVAAGAIIHAGSLVALATATGYVVPATTATGLIALGRAEGAIDNSDGADGDQYLEVLQGVFRWDNSSGGDEVTRLQIGSVCHLVDDQTVAATDGGATRSPAGVVVDIDDDGVWVRTKF